MLAQGEDIAPIPGTRSVARPEENLGAAQITLTALEMSQFTEILPAMETGDIDAGLLPAGQCASAITELVEVEVEEFLPEMVRKAKELLIAPSHNLHDIADTASGLA